VSVVVTGVGVVSPIGVGVPAFFDALSAGRSAVAPDDAPGVPASARVGDFGARQQIAPASLRRMPRLSQLVIVAAKEALAAAAPPYDAARLGVVLGTGLGTLHETITFIEGYLDGGPAAASPLLFPSSVMNAAAGQLAIECKLRGVNSTVNHRDASPLGALALAADLLELGRADAIVCGAADELCAATLDGYALLGRPAPSLRPYDAARAGLVPGESAAMVVLEREADARRRGAPIRARIGACVENGDDRPRVGWGRDAQGAWPEAARAVRQCVAAAGAAPSWIAGGGNGTAYDTRELATLAEGLGAPAPISSILGQSGESLSSSMLRVVAAIYALERQTLPGTIGLADAALPTWSDALVRAPRAAAVETVLVPAFAQGGANVVLSLARASPAARLLQLTVTSSEPSLPQKVASRS
jgi:3-oxoacyl-[acyl-carrier-protein] synthase II